MLPRKRAVGFAVTVVEAARPRLVCRNGDGFELLAQFELPPKEGEASFS